jgi:hypothetical protein
LVITHLSISYNYVLAGTKRIRKDVKTLSAEHTSTLSTINNLGVIYRDQGKLGEAEMYQRALEGYEKALGAEHTSTLDSGIVLRAKHGVLPFGR